MHANIKHNECTFLKKKKKVNFCDIIATARAGELQQFRLLVRVPDRNRAGIDSTSDCKS